MSYVEHLLAYFGVYALAALGTSIVVGHLGLLSLGHAVFFALGAYTYAVLTLAFEWPALPVIAAGMLLSALASLPLALATQRWRGEFFVLVTLAFQALVYSMLRNAYTAGQPLGAPGNLSNGVYGIAGIPSPAIGSILSGMPHADTVFILLCCALAAGAGFLLLRSPWGRLLRAIRDDELAASSLGKQVLRARCEGFAVSAALVALAGALYAGHVSFIDPGSASLDECIFLVAMVVIGGAGNFRGPIAGALLLLTVPELLRGLAVPDDIAPNLALLIYGATLTLVMHVRPQGVAGSWRVR